MKIVVLLTTLLAVLAGFYLGYGTAGLGGAILFGALIGVGGLLWGLFLGRTVLLLRHHWKVALATAALVLIAAMTWDVYL
jgi:hypothetical protein